MSDNILLSSLSQLFTVSFKIRRTVGVAARFRVVFLRLMPLRFRVGMVTVSAAVVSMTAAAVVSTAVGGSDAGV